MLAALNVAFDLLDLQVQNSQLSQTADALQAQAAAQSAAMVEVQARPPLGTRRAWTGMRPVCSR
ncbi:hypothetical protein [Comamonas sp. JC664]|uniref:hypothetical protein n=1 Tax=Comamonas sp. JC664 TaxID=2801917 RepID=UPI0036146BCB